MVFLGSLNHIRGEQFVISDGRGGGVDRIPSIPVVAQYSDLSEGETDYLKDKVNQLTLRLEALGVTSVANTEGLQQRLLKMANDLRLLDSERERLKAALAELHIIVSREVATKNSEISTDLLKAALVSISDALNVESIGGGYLQDSQKSGGSVIAIKKEMGLIVANMGRNHGVKVGAPLKVIRNSTEIATLRIIDVRDRISGAVVQQLSSSSQAIEIGDKVIFGTSLQGNLQK